MIHLFFFFFKKKAIGGTPHGRRMKSGVWTPPLLSRRHPWRHQSASPLMSPLTQIEFTGDTCGTFCLPRSYYKNNRMLHLPGRFTGVCGRHVKRGPCHTSLIFARTRNIDLFFLGPYLVRQMLTASLIPATAAAVSSLRV